jgi:hypothetical protein
VTRAQRLAAGWKECHGVFDTNPSEHITWLRESSPGFGEIVWRLVGPRWDFGSREAARAHIDRIQRPWKKGLVVRRFWRRKLRKA